MNREALTRCGAFRLMSFEEIREFLYCVCATYEELDNNRRFLLTADDLAVVLFGEISLRGRSVFAGEAVSGEGIIHAYTRAGILVISRSRLFSLCKNVCPCHRRAVVNLASFCL